MVPSVRRIPAPKRSLTAAQAGPAGIHQAMGLLVGPVQMGAPAFEDGRRRRLLPQAMPPVRPTRSMAASVQDLADEFEILVEADGDALFLVLLVGLFQADGQAADAELDLLALGRLGRDLDDQVELGPDDDAGVQAEDRRPSS